MPNRHRYVRQTAVVLMACGLIASLLPGFAAAQDGSTPETLPLHCVQSATVEQPDPSAAETGKVPDITRTIDASQYFRLFPRLPAGRATSIQKAPAPVLAELSERKFGRPRITHCWLNLDEMWDYRTRQYDFNYRIGVHKYGDVKEKARESWGSVRETNVHFYDYLRAFGKHSDEVILTIRRYERDILDGKLGVTMYGGFIKCTADEYYEFYKTAYQAVNEANEELGLEGEARVLVGGPAVTGGGMVTAMDQFFANFSKDDSPDKRLDFVSWHEYGWPYYRMALREGEVQRMLASHGIPKKPMFVTEHSPVHGKFGTHTLNLVNAAGLVKSLYFTNVYSPGLTICPWVQYHIREQQTQFMWFDGPNEPDTRAEELRMLPVGCSMKLLSMHKQWEIAVDNSLERDELVLASVQNDGLAVHVVNYGETRDVQIRVDKLPQVFTALDEGALQLVKYQIDEAHSNGVTGPSYSGGPQIVGEGTLTPVNGSVTLSHAQLMKNGILMWLLVPEKVSAALNQLVRHPKLPAKLPAGAATDIPVLNFAKALDSAWAEAEARIERDGARFRVLVTKSSARPGITFTAPAGCWSVAGLETVEATVKNTGNSTLNVHLAIDGPGADRTHRRKCLQTATSRGINHFTIFPDLSNLTH